jgi:hypothetical protein
VRCGVLREACGGRYIDDSIDQLDFLDLRMGFIASFELEARQPVPSMQRRDLIPWLGFGRGLYNPEMRHCPALIQPSYRG